MYSPRQEKNKYVISLRGRKEEVKKMAKKGLAPISETS